MNSDKLKKILNELRELPSETEWLEFKTATNSFDFKELGKYFSALSNEANLKGRDCGWLIFGIEDATKKIVGSKYRVDSKNGLDSLKKEIADRTTNRITFKDIYELCLPERIIMFQIPAAPNGIPIAWNGHYYGRDGESLVALNINKLERIRNQTKPDWSAQICEEATIKDLEPNAILKARHEYKVKFPKLAEDIDKWDDITFLNKAKVTINGRITMTAIILLGRVESEHFISPSAAKISWILKDEHNIEKDYEHFGPPFLLNTDLCLTKIRNLKYRYLPDNTLFPIEITQYDSYVIREALHNCIAHQDYGLHSRIIVVEKPDELVFVNAGNFIPGSIEAVIKQDAPQSYYRNHFLATAMEKLNMIDTIGGGIKKMFLKQKERFFPLPTYELGKNDEVKVRISGKIIDENYTRLLLNESWLDLSEVILLDKVQKRMKLTKNEIFVLRKKKLIEGRHPNIFVVSKVAEVSGDKASYIKNRPFDHKYYKQLVVEFIREYGSATRKEIDGLLKNKLSDVLNAKQKKTKINNLLNQMANKEHLIKNEGSDHNPKWVIVQ